MWFDEVRPYFTVAQVLGLIPYTFDNGIPSNSRVLRIYSYITLTISILRQLFLISSDSNFHFSKSETPELLKFRWAIVNCVLTNHFICHTFYAYQLKAAVCQIKEFDRALGINFATKSLKIRSWTIIVCTFLLFSIQFFVPPLKLPSFATIYYTYQRIAWFMTIHLFTAVVESLSRRSKHLCKLLSSG